ncbi:hypothetical protein Tco_0155902 [Tanacetum coccineum]
MDIDDEEDENEPELKFPYEEADTLNPPPPTSDSEPEDVIEVEDTVEPEDETIPASVHEVVIMEYLVKPIRRIKDFDESKDHCLTLKNTSYPDQRYGVYNTLVKEEESTGFTLICRIHQEDTAYPCLHFTNNHKGLKTQYDVSRRHYVTPRQGGNARRDEKRNHHNTLASI